MNNVNSNTCIRCGNNRVVVRTWKEKVFGSVIINTQTACPDKACQREVDRDNRKLQKKSSALKLKYEQRKRASKKSAKVTRSSATR